MQTLILLVGVADCSAETVTQCFLHSAYSSNKIRKTQNEHLNIVCQNLNSQ